MAKVITRYRSARPSRPVPLPGSFVPPEPRAAKEIEFPGEDDQFYFYGDERLGEFPWLVFAEPADGVTVSDYTEYGPFNTSSAALTCMQNLARVGDGKNWYAVQDSPQGWDRCIRARWS